MDSIGETLRRERQRLNLDLEQVARETKINRRLLEAIEAEDFDRLPGGVFTRSFVRQYARVLGLDEDEIAAELQRNIQPEPSEPEGAPGPPGEPAIELPRVPEFGVRPRTGSSLPALAGVVAVMLICSAIYAWWQRSSRTPPATPPAAATVTERVNAPDQAPAITQPAAAQTASTVPAAPVTPPPTPLADVPADPDANVRLVLTATEPVWISVRSNGEFIYSGTLQPNETRNLDAAGQVQMTVGNAGGLNVTLNGQPVPSLGATGQVRVVQFSPGGVQIVPRRPPSPSPEAL